MTNQYRYSMLKSIFSVRINGYSVWKKRIQYQTQYIHLLEEVFAAEISTQSFGFYPSQIYFGTPLTSDPHYTERMKPIWKKIKLSLEAIKWKVYAPFDLTDPHAKTPDTLNSYQIRDLDHIKVLTTEVALFDLNRPSHGVGQEVELSVFMPSVGFSKEKVSRLTKGMPGMLIINYKNDRELIYTLLKIFTRSSYKKEPFYLAKCPHHPTMSIYKGKTCLHCLLSSTIHSV